MKNFKVNIYPTEEELTFTSFLHPLTNKRCRKSFKTVKEARAYKHEIESKFKTKNIENYHQLNVEELIIMFAQENSSSYFVQRRMHIIDFVSTFGNQKVLDLTPKAMFHWFDMVQKENNLKRISMKGIKCVLQTFFSYLIDKDIISESPLLTMQYKIYAPPVSVRNILSKEQIAELLEAIKKYSPGYLYPMVKIFAETAGKSKEILALTWDDIDFRSRVVHFKQTLSSRARSLPISEELATILSKRQRVRKEIFLTLRDTPMDKSSANNIIAPFKKQNLYKAPWCLLDLRHSYAVNFLKKGGDIKELQRILGHSNCRDTTRLYGEVASSKITNTTQNPYD